MIRIDLFLALWCCGYLEVFQWSGVGKLQPVDQIWPNACFWVTCELGVVFTFFSDGENKKNNIS